MTQISLKIPSPKIYDAAIVGAGPAGLSAALVLGRCRREVVIFESGEHRNAVSHKIHGFLSREGIAPAKLLHLSRSEIKQYKNVKIVDEKVVDINRRRNHFLLSLVGRKKFLAKKILLATGLMDELPLIPGVSQFYGKSVFVCPYCDGWELQNKSIAVYGQKERGPKFALTVYRWSHNIVLCSDGPVGGSPKEQSSLRKLGIRVIETPIAHLIGHHGFLKEMVFKDGSRLAREILFFNTPRHQRSKLAQRLGCKLTAKDNIECDRLGRTKVEGVFVAGDASSEFKFAIVAAADGARAAYALNCDLIKEETDPRS